MSQIQSMTGFGVGAAEENGIAVKLEIKSVNNRGLKVTVRSRPSLGACEKPLRDLVADKLIRGSVDVYVAIERPVSRETPPIHEDTARAAIESLRRVAVDLDLKDDLTANSLLNIPGIFDLHSDDPVTEAEWPAVAAAADAALGQARAMRQQEGAKLAEALEAQADPIAAFVAAAEKGAPQALERARERLRQRLAEICPNGFTAADNQALEREMCLIADRADVREELDRLHSHLEQYRGILRSGGEIGKRLDFLSQELLREINTIASKTNDTEIIQGAVQAKLAVEKIKEQCANLV